MQVRHLRLVAAALAALLAAGCGAPRHGAAQGRTVCRPPLNPGGRLPGMLDPAYPTTGLYPAPGGLPHGAPGVTLLVRGPALVLDYGQPLEAGGMTRANEVVQGSQSGGWWRAPLAAGYPFRLFGAAVPIFGLVPAPVRTGTAARGMQGVWLVTEWNAPQTLTLLRGTPALASALKPWQAVPAGVDAKNAAAAAAAVRAALAAGWRPVQRLAAAPPCTGGPGQPDAFGDRAELRLPLGVPLLLVAPEYGDLVLEVRPA
jgi:hypothetical protein